MRSTGHFPWLRRDAFAAVLLTGLLIGVVPGARSAEIIPSVGLTKSAESGNTGPARFSGGLAFRGDLAPILKTEIGVSYRDENRAGGDLKIRQWPVTASLWLQPADAIYAGGGVGWYHTTFDYRNSLGIPNETFQKFGVHLGGGVRVPFSENAALDLNGRYVFMQDQRSHLIPDTFNPDFWQTSLGLAIKF